VPVSHLVEGFCANSVSGYGPLVGYGPSNEWLSRYEPALEYKKAEAARGKLSKKKYYPVSSR
jgi:hypothetical protein